MDDEAKSMNRPYYPFCVQIEFTQGCNRDCEFCGTRGIEKKIHYTTPQTISHIAGLLKKFGYEGRILLAGHGEPTLNPEAAKLVGILRANLPSAHISMFTNGYAVLKNPELMHRLFAAGLDSLMFDEYSDNAIFNKVMNLEGLSRYTVDVLRKGTALFDRKKKKRVVIAPPIEQGERRMNRKLCNHCGAGMPPMKQPLEKKCSIIFRDFFIRYDGNVAICCNDFRGEYYVCNILNCRTFEEAYYHPRLEAARRRLMQNDRRFYPCSICDVTPLRPGLLPDKQGKLMMPLPTAEDIATTEKRWPPLAVKRRREWE